MEFLEISKGFHCGWSLLFFIWNWRPLFWIVPWQTVFYQQWLISIFYHRSWFCKYKKFLSFQKRRAHSALTGGFRQPGNLASTEKQHSDWKTHFMCMLCQQVGAITQYRSPFMGFCSSVCPFHMIFEISDSIVSSGQLKPQVLTAYK